MMPTGPVRVGPTKAVVLVLTPSIDLLRKLVSSSNTPGARYSGMMVGGCDGEATAAADRGLRS